MDEKQGPSLTSNTLSKNILNPILDLPPENDSEFNRKRGVKRVLKEGLNNELLDQSKQPETPVIKAQGIKRLKGEGLNRELIIEQTENPAPPSKRGAGKKRLLPQGLINNVISPISSTRQSEETQKTTFTHAKRIVSPPSKSNILPNLEEIVDTESRITTPQKSINNDQKLQTSASTNSQPPSKSSSVSSNKSPVSNVSHSFLQKLADRNKESRVFSPNVPTLPENQYARQKPTVTRKNNSQTKISKAKNYFWTSEKSANKDSTLSVSPYPKTILKTAKMAGNSILMSSKATIATTKDEIKKKPDGFLSNTVGSDTPLPVEETSLHDELVTLGGNSLPKSDTAAVATAKEGIKKNSSGNLSVSAESDKPKKPIETPLMEETSLYDELIKMSQEACGNPDQTFEIQLHADIKLESFQPELPEEQEQDKFIIAAQYQNLDRYKKIDIGTVTKNVFNSTKDVKQINDVFCNEATDVLGGNQDIRDEMRYDSRHIQEETVSHDTCGKQVETIVVHKIEEHDKKDFQKSQVDVVSSKDGRVTMKDGEDMKFVVEPCPYKGDEMSVENDGVIKKISEDVVRETNSILEEKSIPEEHNMAQEGNIIPIATENAYEGVTKKIREEVVRETDIILEEKSNPREHEIMTQEGNTTPSATENTYNTYEMKENINEDYKVISKKNLSSENSIEVNEVDSNAYPEGTDSFDTQGMNLETVEDLFPQEQSNHRKEENILVENGDITKENRKEVVRETDIILEENSIQEDTQETSPEDTDSTNHTQETKEELNTDNAVILEEHTNKVNTENAIETNAVDPKEHHEPTDILDTKGATHQTVDNSCLQEQTNEEHVKKVNTIKNLIKERIAKLEDEARIRASGGEYVHHVDITINNDRNQDTPTYFEAEIAQTSQTMLQVKETYNKGERNGENLIQPDDTFDSEDKDSLAKLKDEPDCKSDTEDTSQVALKVKETLSLSKENVAHDVCDDPNDYMSDHMTVNEDMKSEDEADCKADTEHTSQAALEPKETLSLSKENVACDVCDEPKDEMGDHVTASEGMKAESVSEHHEPIPDIIG